MIGICYTVAGEFWHLLRAPEEDIVLRCILQDSNKLMPLADVQIPFVTVWYPGLQAEACRIKHFLRVDTTFE